MIVTSNKPFSAWGEIFGDDIVAAAIIDRLVHPGIPSQIKKGGAFSTGAKGCIFNRS
jgi:DNA replication protein DnaC